MSPSSWTVNLSSSGPYTLTPVTATVSVSGSGVPANDVVVTVDATPGLQGSFSQSWSPSNVNYPNSAYLTITGSGSYTGTGSFTLSGNPQPGTYTIRVTAATYNKPGDLTACTEINQSTNFTIKVVANPCLTYSPPAGGSCSVPRVDTVSPSSGPDTGGTVVTLTGVNLKESGCPVVTFGGTPALVTSCPSATQITVVAPAHAAGSVDVRVTTTDGMSLVNPTGDQYTYTPTCTGTPCVAGLSPNQGSVSGGDTVTIQGGGFDDGTGTDQVSHVSFGSNITTAITYLSPTKLVVKTPAGTGTVPVTVTLNDGDTSTGGPTFTYVTISLPPPGTSSAPQAHQFTVTVIYYFVPITPGLDFFISNNALYILGEATLRATY
jgi:hypothetical protein